MESSKLKHKASRTTTKESKSYDGELKLETSRKRNYKNYTNIQRLNWTTLNIHWISEKSQGEN